MTKARLALLIAVVALLILLFSLRGIAGFYTDYLWFDEVGFTSVWRGLLFARVVPALVFMGVFFVALLINLIIADRLAPTLTPAMLSADDLSERYRRAVGRYAGRIKVAISALFALIAGVGVSSNWQEWILFRNRVSFGVKDPQFHKDVGFYVFQLPFLRFIFNWTFASLIVVFVVTTAAHYLNGGIRLQGPVQRVTPQVKVHLSVLLALVAIARGFGYYLDRYGLAFSTRGPVHGASYTDVHAQLPALKMLMGIAAIAVVLLIVNIWMRGWTLPVIAVALWALVSAAIGTIYPYAVQRFRVEPNEATRESVYIDRNIKATRAAFGIGDDKLELVKVTSDRNLDAAALQGNTTIQNARLWDPDVAAAGVGNVVRDIYANQQQVAGSYQFADVDMDRYVVGGQVEPVIVSAREINLSNLPNQSWVNRHLRYTHGFGIVASPADKVSANGFFDYLVKDIPLSANDAALKITRPEIYFGETLSGYAVVKTKQSEISIAASDASSTAAPYEGRGGIRLSGTLRRAAFALRFGDYHPLVSGDITGSSRILLFRDIRDRVGKVAPFLELDSNPYPVVVDGRIKWVVDAYTVTDRYPYAQAIVPSNSYLDRSSGLNRRFNYVRNSVKVSVDAYDGTVTLYAVDDIDPLLRAYRKAFPKLFTDGSKMPESLRAHLRYPTDLFEVQADIYRTYHIGSAGNFYSREDQWSIAQDPGTGALTSNGSASSAAGTNTLVTAGGQQLSNESSNVRLMQPYYLQMRLPNEKTDSFVIMQAFVPVATDRSVKTLRSYMVALSDPGSYGKLRVYDLGGKPFEGPSQADATINNTPEISRELTLLNQQGSTVIQGNLQLVPVGNAVMYVRPLYVQAQGSTALPLFRFAVVFFDGKAVIGDTLSQALAKRFAGFVPNGPGGTTSTTRPTGATGPTGSSGPSSGGTISVPSEVQALSQAADQAYTSYLDALKAGNLVESARYNELVGEIVRQLRDCVGGNESQCRAPIPAITDVSATSTTSTSGSTTSSTSAAG